MAFMANLKLSATMGTMFTAITRRLWMTGFPLTTSLIATIKLYPGVGSAMISSWEIRTLRYGAWRISLGMKIEPGGNDPIIARWEYP